jgi:hypothetical protein
MCCGFGSRMRAPFFSPPPFIIEFSARCPGSDLPRREVCGRDCDQTSLFVTPFDSPDLEDPKPLLTCAARMARAGGATPGELWTPLGESSPWTGGQILDHEGRSARTAKLPNPVRGQFRQRSVPTIPKDDFRAASIWSAWTTSDDIEFSQKPARLLKFGRLGRLDGSIFNKKGESVVGVQSRLEHAVNW